MSKIILDCSGLIHKTIHTIGDRLSYEDEQTGLIFGFLRQLFSISKHFEAKDIVFCWDSVKSKRKRFYPDYKKKRKAIELSPEELEIRKILYSQADRLRMKIIPALGFKNSFIKTGLEADDIMAVIVKKYPGNIMVTGDKDLYQMFDYCDISPDGKKIILKAEFDEKYGITPAQWAEAKALAGCDSDSVQGVKGAADPAKSEKSKVFAYLKKELTKGVVYDRLVSSNEMTERNKKLVTLPYEDFDITLVKEEFLMDDWVELFDRLGFQSMLKKDYFLDLRKLFKLK
jgi:5'-3' exonuclease